MLFTCKILGSIVADFKLDKYKEQMLRKCMVDAFTKLPEIIATEDKLEPLRQREDPHPYALVDRALRGQQCLPPYTAVQVYNCLADLKLEFPGDFQPPLYYHLPMFASIEQDITSYEGIHRSSRSFDMAGNMSEPSGNSERGNESELPLNHPLCHAWFLVNNHFQRGSPEPDPKAVEQARKMLRGKHIRPSDTRRRYLCYSCKRLHFSSFTDVSTHRANCLGVPRFFSK